MRASHVFLLLAACLGIGGCGVTGVYVVSLAIPQVEPAPELSDPGAPSSALIKAFEKHDVEQRKVAIRDCLRLADVNYAIADIYETDGRSAEPKLRTSTAMHNVRKLAVFYRNDGKWPSQTYQDLPDALGNFLTDAGLPKDGGLITPEQRAEFIAKHRQIGKAAEYAAQELSKL